MPRMNRLKTLRANAQIKTIEEAAEKYGCSITMVSMMENGNRSPSDKLTQKMCEVLKCTYGDIHGKQKADQLRKKMQMLKCQGV